MLPNQGHLQMICLVNIVCPGKLLAEHISDEAPQRTANKWRLGEDTGRGEADGFSPTAVRYD